MPNTNPIPPADLGAVLANEVGLISKNAICALAGVSPRYVDGMVKAGRLAPPVRLSPKVVRYRMADVKRFLAGWRPPQPE